MCTWGGSLGTWLWKYTRYGRDRKTVGTDFSIAVSRLLAWPHSHRQDRVNHMPIVGRYNGVVTKATKKASAKRNGNAAKNGSSPKPEVSELGRVLQKLADKYAASGGKRLNRRQLQREVAERRGLRWSRVG